MSNDALTCVMNDRDTSSPPTSPLQTFVLFASLFFPSLALIITAMRLTGRRAADVFGYDDALIGFAMLLSIGEMAVSYFFIKSNFVGIPFRDISPQDSNEAGIWNYVVGVLGSPILATVKSSVLVFLLRLFGSKTKARHTILALLGLIVAEGVASFFVQLLRCIPISFNWDKNMPDGRCIDLRVALPAMAGWDVLTDIFVLLLPLWILARLKVPKPNVWLLFVFFVGFLVTVASTIRLILLVQGTFNDQEADSRKFISDLVFTISAIESNLALIAASVPTLRPILRTRSRGGWLPDWAFASPFRCGSDDISVSEITGITKALELGRTATNATVLTGTTRRPSDDRDGSRGRSQTRSWGGINRNGTSASARGRRGAISDAPHRARDSVPVSPRSQSVPAPAPGPASGPASPVKGPTRMMRDFQREIDGIVKGMDVGPGSYGSLDVAAGKTKNTGNAGQTKHRHPHGQRPRTASERERARRQAAVDASGWSLQQRPTSEPRKKSTAPASPDEDVPPQVSLRDSTFGRMRYLPEREGSPTVVADGEVRNDRGDRDYHQERLSRYGEKRFGVITHEARTSGGWDEAGRPF